MSEMIRTTRNTFDTLKAKLGARLDLVAKVEAGAKIRAQEVAFVVEPNTPESQAIAAILDSHGEGGRMGQALDRIRAICLGQSAPAKTEVTETTTESGRVVEVPTEVVKEFARDPSGPIREAAGTPAVATDAQTDAKEEASAFAATNFVSWREQFGKLYAEGTLAPEGKKKA